MIQSYWTMHYTIQSMLTMTIKLKVYNYIPNNITDGDIDQNYELHIYNNYYFIIIIEIIIIIIIIIITSQVEI